MFLFVVIIFSSRNEHNYFCLQRDSINLEPSNVAQCVSKGKSEVRVTLYVMVQYCRQNKMNLKDVHSSLNYSQLALFHEGLIPFLTVSGGRQAYFIAGGLTATLVPLY